MKGWYFSKFNHSYWTDKKFRALNMEAQLLTLYYLTSKHQNSTGCYFLPSGYAMADLGWSEEVYHRARSGLIKNGLLAVDDDTSEIFLRNWYDHNPATNDSHATGCRRQIEKIQSDTLRKLVSDTFEEVDKNRPPDQPKKPRREDLTRLINSTASNLDQRRKDPFSRM